MQRLSISVSLLQFMIIVNSLTFSNFTLVTSMLIMELSLFLRYADWLFSLLFSFSIVIGQCCLSSPTRSRSTVM